MSAHPPPWSVVVPAASLALLLVFASPASAAAFHVHIPGNFFDPPLLSTSVGDSVRWHNHDGVAHTATAFDKTFDSGVLGQGQSFEQPFQVDRAVRYECTIHHFVGNLVVGDPPAGADLVVTRLSVVNGTGLPGASKQVLFSVSNYGLSAAGANRVTAEYFYHGSWHPIAKPNVNALAPGSGQPFVVNWDTFGLVGDFEVRVVADADSQVAEDREDNNVAATSTTVLLPVSGVAGVNVFEPL